MCPDELNRMSAFDAVDGSSTGTEVPWMRVLLRPPPFRGAKTCQRGTAVTSERMTKRAGDVIVRRRLKRPHGVNSVDLKSRLGDVETDCRDCLHSMRLIPLLVARTSGSWSYGAPDAAGLRQA